LVKIERVLDMSLDKAKSLFVELVANVPPEQWDARLVEMADGDDELRRQVKKILAAHREAGSFLDSPAPAIGATIEEPASEEPGDMIGSYKLLEQIGEGGMGTVWMAEQKEPIQRRVAVKVIKAGMDTAQVLARFEAERQALALMDHPHIAKVHDAGTTETGRPFFVMELVKGQPITKYCDEHRLTLRQRLELFLPVCHAIQHAHQKGIIHRDVKPSNVLVGVYDGRPVVKVIDFGVAKAAGPKLTERTLFTEFGAVVGTLEYMSPEQAQLDNVDVDTRSDIYSLGVLLYELLTGTTPLDRQRLKQAAFMEMLRVIREEEPPKPSTRLSTSESLPSLSAQRQLEPAKLTRLVRGELDWIVMKALEKDRTRRYETANGFALDVQRYLADEPVLACPPSAAYRFRKLARRNKRALVVTTGLAIMLLVAALTLVVSTYLVWREKGRTQEANLRLKDNLDLAMQTLDEIYVKVAEERLPRDPARKQEHLDLLKKALGFYERFAQQNSSDAEVRKAQALAYRRAGAIRQLLDQFADAEKDLGRAINLYDALWAERPADRDVRFGLATAYLNLALMQFRSGRHAESLHHMDLCQPLLEALITDDPGEQGYRRDLAQALNNRGTLLMLERRMPEAQSAYERAAELWRQLVRDNPDALDFRAGEGEILTNLGYLHTNLGHMAEAEKIFDRAIPVYQHLVEQDPSGTKWRRQQGVVHSNRALLLLRRMGRLLDAEKASAEAIRVQRRLVADFSTVPEFQADLALSLLNRTDVLGALGRFTDAEESHRESLKYLEPLAKNFPEVPGYRRDQALNYLGLSRVHQLNGKLAEAEQVLQRAVAIQEELTAKHPTVPEYQRDLAKSGFALAFVLGERNHPADAQAAFRRALALQEALVKGWPDVTEYRKDLAETLHEHARSLRMAKRLDEAEMPSARALELWEQLVAEYPAVAEYRVYLGGHLNNRGQLFRDRGDLNRACEFFERAIKHQEEARKLDPGSAMAQAFLRNHYSNLADVLTRLGKHAEAARAAEHLPRVVPDEFHRHAAALLLLSCVRLAEKDASLSAPDRAAAVRLYTERMRRLLDEADRHRSHAPAVAITPAQGSWTVPYNIACTYAFLAGIGNDDSNRRDHYVVRAVQLLREATQRGKDAAEILKQLKADADLDPLRMHEEFKKLLAELDRKKGASP
jgi:serine/threonine protein kinase